MAPQARWPVSPIPCSCAPSPSTAAAPLSIPSNSPPPLPPAAGSAEAAGSLSASADCSAATWLAAKARSAPQPPQNHFRNRHNLRCVEMYLHGWYFQYPVGAPPRPAAEVRHRRFAYRGAHTQPELLLSMFQPVQVSTGQGSPFKTTGLLAGSTGYAFYSVGTDWIHTYRLASSSESSARPQTPKGADPTECATGVPPVRPAPGKLALR
jgi:hypothetical protein